MLMIFGWGKVTVRDHGPTVPATCVNCHNQGMQHYVHARTWFTLFFIPVIPYRSQRLLLCPVCGRGAKLTPEQGALAAEMPPLHDQWRAGTLPEKEYLDRVSSFWLAVNPPAHDPAAAPGFDPARAPEPSTEASDPTA